MDPFPVKSLLFLLFSVGCCAAQRVLPPGPVDAVLGKDVTFQTLVNKPDYAFIVWNFNNGKEQINVATASATGVKVHTLYTDRVSMNRTTGSMTLKAVKTEDSGLYGISIISPDGTTQTAEIQLRVLKPVSDVVIKANLPEAIEHNSTVVLTCSAKGSFLKFTWTNNTVPIVADGSRLTLKEDAESSTLTITGVFRTDLVGPIVCTASNNVEKDKSAPFSLTVYYGPDTVTVSPPNTPEFIRSDSNFSLSCSALSSPPATYTWYHNQQVIETAGAVLSMKVLKAQGLGKQLEQYTCRAQNAKTQRIVPSPAVTFAVMEVISGVTVTGPTVPLIAGNSTANVSCQATAGTVKSRKWMKDGKPLTASPPHLVFSADSSSLMIVPLQKEDRGEYTCHLENPVSTDKASYKMVVNFGPEAATVTGEKAVEVNKDVTLTCTASSFPPANFTWKFNDTLTGVKAAQYVIHEATDTNTGTYTCEAYNAVTGKTSTYTHKLAVKAPGTLDKGLSDGAIAGIVIAILVAIAAAIAVIFYCRQKVPIESPY
ncbi:carcinoembryonic antigen-related cell adhesion molecule 5 [Mastacembelus armatus]|uniref:Carcinoembryonic antigen-related cell adhesion molecule 5-like n=1 Tax=Mastacembelus armatus TaxID=205130 RepID=A0A3Q3SVI6_9TELE|nr:carcinoembryonic antigen-related cell adhesion molecule 5-like [Mastacembelus armatus]